MTGLVLVTHGEFSRGLADSLALIAGPYENMVTLSLRKNDNAEDLQKEIEEAIGKVDQGDGVIIFTDVLGGTPSNLATLIARKKKICCLTGVNLPMLVEFAMSSEDNLSVEKLAEKCLTAASAGVLMTNKLN